MKLWWCVDNSEGLWGGSREPIPVGSGEPWPRDLGGITVLSCACGSLACFVNTFICKPDVRLQMWPGCGPVDALDTRSLCHGLDKVRSVNLPSVQVHFLLINKTVFYLQASRGTLAHTFYDGTHIPAVQTFPAQKGQQQCRYYCYDCIFVKNTILMLLCDLSHLLARSDFIAIALSQDMYLKYYLEFFMLKVLTFVHLEMLMYKTCKCGLKLCCYFLK